MKELHAFLENSEKNALAFVDIEGNIGSFAKLSLLFYTKEFIWKSLCSQSNYNLCYIPLSELSLVNRFEICCRLRLQSSPKGDEVTKLGVL